MIRTESNNFQHSSFQNEGHSTWLTFRHHRRLIRRNQNCTRNTQADTSGSRDTYQPIESILLQHRISKILAKPDAFRPGEYMNDILSLFTRHGPASFRFVEGLPTSINEHNRVAKLASYEEISYDYPIIASGSTTQSTEGLDSDMTPGKAR